MALRMARNSKDSAGSVLPQVEQPGQMSSLTGSASIGLSQRNRETEPHSPARLGAGEWGGTGKRHKRA